MLNPSQGHRALDFFQNIRVDGNVVGAHAQCTEGYRFRLASRSRRFRMSTQP